MHKNKSFPVQIIYKVLLVIAGLLQNIKLDFCKFKHNTWGPSLHTYATQTLPVRFLPLNVTLCRQYFTAFVFKSLLNLVENIFLLIKTNRNYQHVGSQILISKCNEKGEPDYSYNSFRRRFLTSFYEKHFFKHLPVL